MLKNWSLSFFLGLLLSIVASDDSAGEALLDGGFIGPQEVFKHQVSLLFLVGDCTLQFCEGAILDEQHIITTAHCVSKSMVIRNISNFVVVAGTDDLRNKTASVYRTVDYIYEPKETEDVHPSHDLAILKLRSPLPLGTDARLEPINLPVADRTYGFKFFTSGYAFYKQRPNRSLILDMPQPVLRYQVESVADYPFSCNSNDICTTVYYQSTTCNSVGGAPLIHVSTRTLLGLSKFPSHYTCGKWAKYTRVSAYLNFIDNVRNQVFSDVTSRKLSSHDDEDKIIRLPYCKYN